MANEEKLDPRHKRFLDHYLTSGDIGGSYLAAGYQCSADSACAGGSRLLRKLDEKLNHLEVFRNEGLTVRSIAKRLNELMNGPDESVAIRALSFASKCLQLQRDAVFPRRYADRD